MRTCLVCRYPRERVPQNFAALVCPTSRREDRGIGAFQEEDFRSHHSTKNQLDYQQGNRCLGLERKAKSVRTMPGSSISAWVRKRICGRERRRGIGRRERARGSGIRSLRVSMVAGACSEKLNVVYKEYRAPEILLWKERDAKYSVEYLAFLS